MSEWIEQFWVPLGLIFLLFVALYFTLKGAVAFINPYREATHT